MNKFKEKVVVVTGGNSGIGKALIVGTDLVIDGGFPSLAEGKTI